MWMEKHKQIKKRKTTLQSETLLSGPPYSPDKTQNYTKLQLIITKNKLNVRFISLPLSLVQPYSTSMRCSFPFSFILSYFFHSLSLLEEVGSTTLNRAPNWHITSIFFRDSIKLVSSFFNPVSGPGWEEGQPNLKTHLFLSVLHLKVQFSHTVSELFENSLQIRYVWRC